MKKLPHSQIEELIKILNKHPEIGEIEVEGNKIRVSKQGTTVAAAPMAYAPPAAPAAEPKEKKKSSKKSDDDMKNKHAVKSPMVGTIYLAPTPGAGPFVEVGQQVKKGEVVCLIEAMKMYNQIEADKDGTITARLVENSAPVEFGQPLFIIE
ncbi:MAG: acetyl-CoA carboxylase biotin carboxyl carrier protein [Gammaproteobacteria bacterium]